MDIWTADPIGYLNQWLRDPIHAPSERSVEAIISALNAHPMAQDETAQDYVMPAIRTREEAGQFRIFGECQDTWYCFVVAGSEREENPPVLFESHLDLERDYGCAPDDIIDGEYVQVCSKFTEFLWHVIGRQICLRISDSGYFRDGVCGISWKGTVAPRGGFINPLNVDFPAGFNCLIAEDTLCIPDWGAAFRSVQARERFIGEYRPTVRGAWPK